MTSNTSLIDPSLVSRAIIGVAVTLLIVTWIVLLVFTQKFRPIGAYNENGEWEWENDGREAQLDNQVLFAAQYINIAIMAVAAGIGYTCFKIMQQRRRSGQDDTVVSTSSNNNNNNTNIEMHANIGKLAGALFVLANMSLVSAFYFWDFSQDDENDENNNNNNRMLQDNNDDENGEEYEEGYMEQVFTKYEMIFFCIFLLVSIALLAVAYRFIPLLSTSTTSGSSSSEQAAAATVAAEQEGGDAKALLTTSVTRVEMLKDIYQMVSIVSIVCMATVWLIAVIAPIIMFYRGEDNDRMREEGTYSNLRWTSFTILVFVVILSVLGHRTINTTSNSPRHALEIGFFQASVCGFPVVALLLAALYNGVAVGMFRGEGDRGRQGMEDGPVGTLLFASGCLTVAVLYTVCAILVTKHMESINDMNNTNTNNNSSNNEAMTDNGSYVEMTEDPAKV